MTQDSQRNQNEIPCAWCGKTVDPQLEHQVAADYSGSDVAIRSFCTQSCREEWLVNNDAAANPDAPPTADAKDAASRTRTPSEQEDNA